MQMQGIPDSEKKNYAAESLLGSSFTIILQLSSESSTSQRLCITTVLPTMLWQQATLPAQTLLNATHIQQNNVSLFQ